MSSVSREFRFVHCADLHLDSPFEGIHAVEPAIATKLKGATFKAFDDVINLAIRNYADFLIIAGDVYDGADRSLRAQLRFRDALRHAVEQGIQCFVAHGNHDPLSGWEAELTMPKGVHRFSGEHVERIVVKRGAEELAHVYGISYPDRDVRDNLALKFRRETDTPFAIGVLHCNVGGDPSHDNYAPCMVEDLLRCRMDYWALGHIHTRKVLNKFNPCIVYPGNTQGRSVRELGERGCYLVRVGATGSITTEFMATDTVRWFSEEVNISDLNTIDDLLDALDKVCKDVRASAKGRASVLRLLLIGRGDLHAKLRHIDTERDLAFPLREKETERTDFVWVESIQVATRPTIDIVQRRAVKDFIGDFLRSAESMRMQLNYGEVIRKLLSSRSEYRIIARQFDHLSDTDLLSILDQAETLGLDYLTEEE